MRRATPLQRVCANCSGPIVQGPNEHTSRYELRVYCGAKCARRRQARHGGACAPPAPLDAGVKMRQT